MGRRRRLLPHQRAEPRASRSSSCASGIPYKVVGGTRFYDRREVKDALAYLQAVVNPADEVSIKRVLNVPKRGVGDSTVGRLDAWADAPTACAFIEALRRADDAGVTGRGGEGHRRRSSSCSTISADARGRRARRALLEAVLDRSGYVAELEAEHTIEAEGRLENLAELVGVAREFDDGRRRSSSRSALVADTDDARRRATRRRSCS